MIFSVQHYIEDYFEKLGLRDVDQYAVRLANVYSSLRANSTDEEILRSIHRVHTVFYRNNNTLKRSDFESKLLGILDRHFKKKASHWNFQAVS